MKLKTILFSLLLLPLINCSSEEPEVEMEALFSFDGNWIGNWSDSLFPAIPVSARVSQSGDDRYSGSFFYNNSGNAPYTPCCGGSNDGRISFTTDGDKVMNFKYVQTAPEYRGGCPGEYNGEGEIDRALNRLVITFTGTDCDGFHDNGRIVWQLDQ